jgi:MscS family membrane protein
MVDTIIDNISLRTQRKVETRLEIGLAATAQQLKEISPAIRSLLGQYTAVEQFQVYLMDTGKNAHILAIDYFTSIEQTLEEFNLLREAVNLALIDLLEKSGLELAAASTDIVVTNKG